MRSATTTVVSCLVFFLILFASFCIYSEDAPPSAFHPEGDVQSWEKPAVPAAEGEYQPPVLAIEDQPLAARIAQMMLVTLEGVTAPSAQDLNFLKQTFPGGVMLTHAFKASEAITYVGILRALEKSGGLPLLLGANLYQLTDDVRMMPGEFVQLPSLLSLTAAGDPDLVKSVGSLMAQYMQLMGFNFHFGPTLELAPTLEGAPDTVNTFGSNPRFVSEAGALFFDAFQESGILHMPSGFPGGGGNRIGRGAAVLTTPASTLLESDGLPYKTLIERGVRMLHVGNVLAPTLDMENRPASMSPAVISGLLRDEMGFDGVVVAGPMDDEVLLGRYDISEAALQAILAGADMLYFRGGLVQVMRAMERIRYAVETEELNEARINASIARIKTLKEGLTKPGKAPSEQKANSQARKKDLVEISRKVERHAITLLKNEGNVLPLVNKISTPVGITGIVGVEELHALLEKELKPLAQQRITTARHIGEIQRFEIERLTKHMRGFRTIICILTDKARPETQAELVRALKGSAQSVVVVYLGHPRNAAMITGADAVVLAYCDAANFAQTMQAMAEILMGNAPMSILPVESPIRLRVGESRSFNAYEIIQAPSGRLPVTLSDRYPAGTAARYSPAESVKHVEWNFGGDRVKKESVPRTFDNPGETVVTLSVTDENNEVSSRTFSVVAGE
ncbi:MAG: hypothetical protein GXY07_12570 [Candidatus Hydrogenedentes bacterium]|nr:hypothetical protein [Candidatus Hydrogenedentota bacterium]